MLRNNAFWIAALFTADVIGLTLADAAVRVETLDANSAQTRTFTVGQRIVARVVNEGDPVCHTALFRPTNEIFGGESLQVERQVGDNNWQTVGPTYGDEPSYVYGAMPRGGSIVRRWRAAQTGMYRFRFRYLNARPDGTCLSSAGWHVQYSVPLSVRNGSNNVRLSIVERTSDSVRYGGNLDVNVSVEYFLESAPGPSSVAVYLEWFPSSSGGCSGTTSSTVASESVPASTGSGTANFHLHWTVDRAAGWVGLGANLWNSSSSRAASAEEFRHCMAIGR